MKADVNAVYLRKADARRRFARLEAFAAGLTTWLAVGRHYYAASARYEDLSRLSDAELERRGLERTTLGQHTCAEGTGEERRSR